MPPFVLSTPHGVHNEKLDYDWTLASTRTDELSRREQRNELIKLQLRHGLHVCYRSSGWSLWPRVKPDDQTTYKPVWSADEVKKDDIVFCEVQPGDRFFAHLVKEKYWGWQWSK